MGLSFNFRTGLRENLSATHVLRRRLFPIRYQLLILASVFVPVAAGAGVGFLAAVLAKSTINAPVFVLLGVIGGILAGRPLVAVANRWSIKQRGGAAADEDVESAVLLDDQGIQIFSPFSETRIAWAGVAYIFADKGTLYFVRGLWAYYVPARCFANELERKAAIDYAVARLTPEARKRSFA